LALIGAEKCNVIIIGAGMSGLNAAKKLKEIGVPFAVYEKGAQLGGTWLVLHIISL
jgi:4-hydroxyacetophenone monooxygenase